jgi:hypothetical protein
MANSFQASKRRVTGTMESTGASTAILAPSGCLVDVVCDFATGSFSGTIALQTKATEADTWVTIEEYTTDTAKIAQMAAPREYRLNCTTATSNTAAIELTVGPQI